MCLAYLFTMEQLSLLNAKLNQLYVVEKIESGLQERIEKRLLSLGIFKNSRITLIKRSKFSGAGIVFVMGSKVCLDNKILEKVIVRAL